MADSRRKDGSNEDRQAGGGGPRVGWCDRGSDPVAVAHGPGGMGAGGFDDSADGAEFGILPWVLPGRLLVDTSEGLPCVLVSFVCRLGFWGGGWCGLRPGVVGWVRGWRWGAAGSSQGPQRAARVIPCPDFSCKRFLNSGLLPRLRQGTLCRSPPIPNASVTIGGSVLPTHRG